MSNCSMPMRLRQASKLSTKNASVSARLEAVNLGRDESPQPSQSTRWIPPCSPG